MVDVSYQMVLSTLQTTGLLVGIFYYIMTLRNTQKTRELTLQSQELTRQSQEQATDTREAQLFMNLYEVYRDMDFRRQWYRTDSWEWSDIDDFMSKYGPEIDVEAFSTFNSVLGFFEGVGMLVRRGYVELDLVEDLLDIPAESIWERFKDIVFASRQRQNWPQLFANYEYLIHELRKRKKAQTMNTNP